jgi:hypothetical protein
LLFRPHEGHVADEQTHPRCNPYELLRKRKKELRWRTFLFGDHDLIPGGLLLARGANNWLVTDWVAG